MKNSSKWAGAHEVAFEGGREVPLEVIDSAQALQGCGVMGRGGGAGGSNLLEDIK